MFWFLFGIVAVSFAVGALVGYKFYEYKEYKDYKWDQDAH